MIWNSCAKSGARLLLLCGALLLSACAAMTRPLPVASKLIGPGPAQVHVAVTRTTDSRWQVDYRFDEAVDAWQFSSGRALNREKTWQVLTPGVHIHANADAVWLARDDGKSLTQVSLRFDDNSDEIDRDYSLVVPFSDGGRLLFLGHLLLTPMTGEKSGGPGDGTVSVTTRFEARDESPIGADGQAREIYLSAADAPDYAYFGHAMSIAGADIEAVIDPATPTWVRDSLIRELPRLLGYYRERFGAALPVKPHVFLNYQPEQGEGFNGDAMPTMLHLTLRGESWQHPDPAAQAQLLFFIAHEAAHLWNGHYLHSTEGHQAAWLHEGGADAAAYDALKALGLISEADWRNQFALALNKCRSALGQYPMQEAYSHHNSHALYSCGSTMQNVLALSMRRPQIDADSFELWRAWVTSASARHYEYTRKDFFQFAQQHASAAMVNDLHELAETKVANPTALIEALLHEAGLDFIEDNDDMPPEMRSNVSSAQMAALMATDCMGQTNFWSNPTQFDIGGLADCHHLVKEHYLVAAIAGVPVADGVKIHDALHNLCAENRPVTLTLKGGDSIEVKCPEDLPPVANWIQPVWPD